MRFFSTLLLCTWGFLSLLGNAGIHAFAERLGVCCVRTDEGSDAKSDCHHDGCAFCSKRAANEKESSESSKPGTPTGENAPHDAEHCHLCDWLAKCQSQTIAFVCVIAESALEFRHVDVQTSYLAVEVVVAASRGPPVVG